MIRTIIWFIYFWLYLILTLPFLIYCYVLKKLGKTKTCDKIVYFVARSWSRSLIFIAGCRVIVSGEENVPEGSVVFVGNHQGNFDVPIYLGFITKPKGFIAKLEVKNMPIINSWMEFMKCVFIDRADIRQTVSVLNDATEYLKQGYSTVIFPEGTRSKCVNIGEFKAGSLKFAVKSSTPIVPVAISGSYKIMESNKGIIKPATVYVKIYPPIYTDGLTKEEISNLNTKVKEIIAS